MTLDPDATLAEIRLLARFNYLHPHAQPARAARLSDLVEALDEHLTAGDTLPADWTRRP